MKKRILMIVLITACLLTACKSEEIVDVNANDATETLEVVTETVEETDTEEEGKILPKVKINVDALNFRRSPTVDSEKLGEVYRGCVYEVLKSEEVKVSDKSEVWYLIKAGNEVGWIASWFTESTNETPKDFLVKEMSYDFMEYYNVGDLLLMPEDENMAIVLDDQVLEEEHKFTQAGMYEVKLRYTDKLGRIAETEKVDIQVIDALTYRIYKNFTDSEPEDRVVKLDDLEFTGQVVIYDGVWYECESVLYKGYIKPDHGIYPISKVNEIVLSNEKKVLTGDYTFKVDSQENCLHFVDGNNENLFVHLPSGKKIEWPYAYELRPDDQLLLYMLPFHFHQRNKQETESFKLYDLASENCDVLFETDDTYAYLELLEDGTYRSGLLSDDPWFSSNHNVSNEIVDVANVDGEWQLKVLSSPIERTDEAFNVYGTMKNAGPFSVHYPSKVVKIESTDVYDIIDDQLVMWFKVTLPDGSYGYAYRPRWSYEKESILITKDFYLMLEDGTYVEIEGEYDDFFLVRDLTEAFVKMNAYAITRSYEGSYTLVYSKTDGKIINDFDDTNVYQFKEVEKLLFEKWSYGDDSFELTIYDISDDDFKEEFSYKSDMAYVNDLAVINDNRISLVINSDKVYEASIEYVDNQWIITTEFEPKFYD